MTTRSPVPYEPMRLVGLAGFLAAADDDSHSWRRIAEFLEEYRHETAADRAAHRRLAVFWFPFNTAAARVDAIVHAPAAFRSRGIFLAPQELSVA